MRKAFGAFEFLFVIIIIIILYFMYFHSNYGRSNPFDDNAKIKSQQELVDDKIQEIEDSKALRKKIEENLNKEY